MNREDIIRMAREAGLMPASFCRWSAYSDDLERFAALVAAAEREACARVCEWFSEKSGDEVDDIVELAADTIRARGEK